MGKSVSNPQLTAAEKRVLRFVNKWHKSFGVDRLGLNVKHKYLPSYGEDHLTIATTQASWQYRYAVIEWYLPAVARLDDEGLEEAVIHEYIHAFLASMESRVPEDGSEYCEFAVETMTQAILNLVGTQK